MALVQILEMAEHGYAYVKTLLKLQIISQKKVYRNTIFASCFTALLSLLVSFLSLKSLFVIVCRKKQLNEVVIYQHDILPMLKATLALYCSTYNNLRQCFTNTKKIVFMFRVDVRLIEFHHIGCPLNLMLQLRYQEVGKLGK